MGNNSDPVFLEVCIGGHPDEASQYGRSYRDEFCTSSLHLFEWVDMDWRNFTIWNSSTIAGPVAGGTEVSLTTRDTYHPTGGVISYGKPTCLFDGQPAPAKLHGYQPKRFSSSQQETNIMNMLPARCFGLWCA